MPNKYLNNKGIEIKKQKYKTTNWSVYNKALVNRGDVEVWLGNDAVDKWYEEDQVNTGHGTPQAYTDFAILVCHQMRQVYRLPLRQTEGFINSIFRMMKLNIKCPSYSMLSKRLCKLNIECPMYKKDCRSDDSVHAIAIDSTGLKRFGRDEWHQEKHKVDAKRSWRKWHAGVDQNHYIVGCKLTARSVPDDKVVPDIVKQIGKKIEHFTGDKAYDSNEVYRIISENNPDSHIVIPPKKGAVVTDKSHAKRNVNTEEVDDIGVMAWQKKNKYGQRNYSELAMQRYKRILGNKLHSREFSRQEQEAMIGASILNKMTSLGMPQSYRSA